jgi:hypothetical protein
MVDDVTDTMEACRYHFFCHRYCSATFWEEERGNFYGDGLFHHGVTIGERYAATITDTNSTINLISIEVIEQLQIATRARTLPYLLHSSYGTLLISHIADVPITFGGHSKVVHCGVSPMPLDSCHILLGYHWCHNYQVQPYRDEMKVSFKRNKKRRALSLCATAK